MTDVQIPPPEAAPPQDPAPSGRLARALAARRRLPENVRLLGWVSLANDAASELSYPIIPLFLTIVLGAPVVLLGVIEGIAEGMALGFKLLSGWLSDRTAEQRRRPLIMFGYGVSTFARVGIAAAPTWGWVLGAKIVDRIGKGTRGTPRDALIRDSTAPELRGAAFGYHRSMDTVGAIIGPLLAVVMLALGWSLRTILWVGVLPGAFTLLLIRSIREAPPGAVKRSNVTTADAKSLPAAFWTVLLIWVVFSLGNSSDAFLLLRAHNLGMAALVAVLAYTSYNVVYASLSWPLGALSDRIPRERLLGLGLVVFALVYAGFAAASSTWVVWPLFIFYGLYIAATEGVARAWVADQAIAGKVGTAYGVFYAATAGAALVASIAGGVLWSYVSPSAPFVLGAVTSSLAALALGVRALRREAGPRFAQVALATLAVAVVAFAAVDHSHLYDLLKRRGDAEVPIASAARCSPLPSAAHVTLPAVIPPLPGAIYTGEETGGGGALLRGVRIGSLRQGHDAFQAALMRAGYTITFSEVDPTDSEVDWVNGGVQGDVQFLQECRSRVRFTITTG